MNKFLLFFLLMPFTAYSQSDSLKLPFAFGDFSWMNGTNRQTSNLISNSFFTGMFYFDGYYNYSFNRPIDNTITGTTVTGRHNEFTLNMACVGGDFNYKNVRGQLYLQTGSVVNMIQSQDGSVKRGLNNNTDAYKYIKEATAGYHWNKWYGINLDMGIFMSFIGLESYLTQENWNYQRSFVSDFTPFYFKGLRLQTFPTQRLKVELWLMNGWQSYSKFNNTSSAGYSINTRPKEALSLTLNGYYGFDTPGNTTLQRLHFDNSLLLRYFNRSQSNLSRGAVSLTFDYGNETSNTISSSQYNFVGLSAAHRLQFFKNKVGLTERFSLVNNPGRYLVISPTTTGFNDNSNTFRASDYTLTLDFMPNDFITFRTEYIYRQADIPYFAGRNGTTSPDGFINPAANGIWTPDLSKTESRIILAVNVRF